MKKAVLVALCFSSNILCYNQVPAGENFPTIYNGVGDFKSASGLDNIVNAALLNTNGLKFATNKRVEGSAFLNNDWNWGYIRFPNGATIDSLRIRYHALNNELYFLDGEREYYLNDNFREFGYAEVQKDMMQKIVFHNNFPAIGTNSIKTNYRVLAGKDYLLLKQVKKELVELRSLDGQSYYRITDEEIYFVYNTIAKKMIRIHKGVQPLQADLPEVKDQIVTISNNEKLKCKSEPDLVALFNKLVSPVSEENKKAF